MNSERRHELQQNVLAGYLARINESVEPYSKLIAVVVGALIIAAVALVLYQSSASGQRSDATLQLVQAAGEDDAEVLAAVGDQYGKTPAGAWARLYQADELMARGLRVLYTDRSEAEQLLGDAKTAYQQAISSGDERLLQSRAHFGLGRIAESLGNAEEAITHYRDTIAANESEAMVEVAQQRIDSLSSDQTQKFLAWFSEQNFSPADPALPPALPSGTSLPDLPDLDLPDLDLPDLDNDAASQEMPPATEPPPANEAAEANDSGIAMPAEPTTETATETTPESEPETKPDSEPEAKPGSEPETEPETADPENGDETEPAEPATADNESP